MNPFSYEVELYALAVLLYLADASVLLYGNEAVLTNTGAQRWSASWGWSGFSLARRTLCMLNPFTPHRASYRLSWDFCAADRKDLDHQWPESAQRLENLAPWVLLAGTALFGILPIGLFSPVGAYAIGAALLLLYGSVSAALYRLHRERGVLALTGKPFWSFAFECIACPPFGVNMLRRITLALPVKEPLPIAAQRLLDADQWVGLRAECLSRVGSVLQSVDEGSQEHMALTAHKIWLADYPSD